MAKSADIEIIRAALKKYRRWAWSHRYGGMGKDAKLAKQALEALDRIEESIQNEPNMGSNRD